MAGTHIHPLASVAPDAELGENVSIGPFCLVESGTVLGDRVELKSHVSVLAGTSLGADSVVWPNSVLGGDPQNKAHKGGPARLVIGARTVIREACTFNRGTDSARALTSIGDDGYFMTGSHIAHDCNVGHRVTFANGATLGGHVEVGDNVTIGGFAAVHQFCRIGRMAFIGGMSAVVGDVMPFAIALGNRARLRGLNLIGLRRSGMDRAEIIALKKAYTMLFDRSATMETNLPRVAEAFGQSSAVAEMLAFFSDRQKRHFCVPPVRGASAGDAADDEG
ncbi:MAG: acyl-ACP--UDP-N-acetylglucosamine O-acyltransferase [Rhizobiaceae bacterium]